MAVGGGEKVDVYTSFSICFSSFTTWKEAFPNVLFWDFNSVSFGLPLDVLILDQNIIIIMTDRTTATPTVVDVTRIETYDISELLSNNIW